VFSLTGGEFFPARTNAPPGGKEHASSRIEILETNQLKDKLSLTKKAHDVERTLLRMNIIRKNDGDLVLQFHKQLEEFIKEYKKQLNITASELDSIDKILRCFPALVIPLELRDSAAVLQCSTVSKGKENIEKMLGALKDISGTCNPRWYAWGFVISMVESSDDLLNAAALCKLNLGSLKIPIIPLFEKEQSLDEATKIIEECLSRASIKTAIKKHWAGNFEIMLGYSDSAKEIGVLPSRYKIATTMQNISKQFKKLPYRAVYFHGSGGSVARGGGSLEEQIRWWPQDTKKTYKVTVQGEMVAKTLSNEVIFDRNIEKITSSLKFDPKFKSFQYTADEKKAFAHFCTLIRNRYQSTLQDEDFLTLIESS